MYKKDLAEKFNISYATIAKMGKCEPVALTVLQRICNYLDCDIGDMLYNGDWYKEEKKLATLSEYFVRSKSEVIIANMLFSEEVPFEYEVPLYADDGTMYLPDFTVKFRGEIYYWEHVGRLDMTDYKAHWEKKEKWYEKNFPGKLITTYAR